MYDEDDLLPISALQHLAFCERQWALIHLEGLWQENLLTAEGRLLHERTQAAGSELRGAVRRARSLRLRSLRLGLSGIADVVQFRPVSPPTGLSPPGVSLPGLDGLWQPFPVEFKRGRPKPGPCDEIQLCAQALCLEEMLSAIVPEGALFYGQPRRRHPVLFTPALRAETERLAARLHDLFRRGATPPAEYSPRCESCSLLPSCMPRAASRSVARYLNTALSASGEEIP